MATTAAEKISNNNLAIQQIVREKALEYNQQTAITLLENVHNITAAVVGVCVDTLENMQGAKNLPLSSTLLNRSVKFLNASGVAVCIPIIDNDWEPERLVKEILKEFVGLGVGKVAGIAIGSATGPGLLISAAASYGVGLFMDWGYNQIMDERAIYRAKEDGTGKINCESDISSFLEDEWEDLLEIFPDKWSVYKGGARHITGMEMI